jgi:VIT1/CCC1 family predicted Fe2+/Mn2+ transporter
MGPAPSDLSALLVFLAVACLIGGLVGLLAPRSFSPVRRLAAGLIAVLMTFVVAYLFVIFIFVATILAR